MAVNALCLACDQDLPLRSLGLCVSCYHHHHYAGTLDRYRAVEAFPAVDVSWQDQALCAETDPELFFPEKGGSTREAKAICGACLVRAECLDYALDTGQRFGIWGGCSERERRRLLGLGDDSEEASAA